MAALNPIELSDDGMRLHRVGEIRGYPMVCLHNPELIAHVTAIKAQRRVIKETNERLFSDPR